MANSILIESQEIKRSEFATYAEEKLSDFNNRQITLAEKRINDVLLELEMPVGNESIERNVQPLRNVQPFHIQGSNFQNRTINPNPYLIANLPYSIADGCSSSTWTKESVPTRGNSASYMDFLNSSKCCNIIYSYHMIYNIFLLHAIIEWKTYNLQLKYIQLTVFPLPFQSILGDKIIFEFVFDRFYTGFCIMFTSGCFQCTESIPIISFCHYPSVRFPFSSTWSTIEAGR